MLTSAGYAEVQNPKAILARMRTVRAPADYQFRSGKNAQGYPTQARFCLGGTLLIARSRWLAGKVVPTGQLLP